MNVEDDELELDLRCLVCGAPAVETPVGNATCGQPACAEHFNDKLLRLLDQSSSGGSGKPITVTK